MDDHDDWWAPRSPLFRRLARDLEVHVLAVNAGAELPEIWVDYEGDWRDPWRGVPSGWAAWYAAAEELP